MKPPSIKYLRQHEIDKAAWDACIGKADNGLIYGYSFYLDTMTTNWDALVLDDYDTVMPLPWRKKWGLSYLYQPYAVAQLGVFGKSISSDVVAAFLRAVPKKFRYWDYTLNHANQFVVEGFPFYTRMNYVLPLNKTYETLYKAYRENIRRNIKKSAGYGNKIVTNVDINDIIALTHLQPKAIPESDRAAFKILVNDLGKTEMVKTYGIISNKGELLASAVFLFSHKRAYYVLVGNHPNGRTLGASHALIDAFIRDHAGTDLLLDFEGSDLRNLAFFYSSYGAGQETYPAIKLNRLPWWIKWMKRE